MNTTKITPVGVKNPLYTKFRNCAVCDERTSGNGGAEYVDERGSHVVCFFCAETCSSQNIREVIRRKASL